MISLKKSIIGIFFLILTLHVLASVYHLYWKYRWFDMPMHFLGGLWVAMMFFYFIYPKLQISNYKLLVTVILAVSFVALIGVLWEFFEFLYDVFISSKGYYTFFQVAQQGVRDTMSDLFFDLLGGFVFGSVYFNIVKRKGDFQKNQLLEN